MNVHFPKLISSVVAVLALGACLHAQETVSSEADFFVSPASLTFFLAVVLVLDFFAGVEPFSFFSTFSALVDFPLLSVMILN